MSIRVGVNGTVQSFFRPVHGADHQFEIVAVHDVTDNTTLTDPHHRRTGAIRATC